MCTIFSIRGEKFRTEFSHLNEFRSIIPETVSVMALTATTSTRNFIINSLSMQMPKSFMFLQLEKIFYMQ